MSKRKYIKDYRLNEYISENGRVSSETEYIGGDYRFSAPMERVRRSARLALGLSAISWACFAVLVCVEGSAMRIMYAALPFAFTALPLFLMTRSAVLALRAGEKLRHDEADRIGHTMPAAALWAMLLPGIACLGCALTCAFGAADWDPLFLALSAVMAACGAAAFSRRADFATEKQ